MDTSVLNNHIFGIKQKKVTIHESYYIRDEKNNDIMFARRKLQFWKSFGSAILMLLGLLSTIVSIVIIASVFTSANPSDSLVSGFGVAILILGVSAFFFWAWFKTIPLRHIYFYESEQAAINNPDKFVFEILQGEKLELLKASFYLKDGTGNIIFTMKKNVIKDLLFRKHWFITIGATTFEAVEDNAFLAILRRFVQLASFIPMTFYFLHPQNKDKKIGEFRRKFELFDNYKLDMSADPEFLMNRACAIGIAVLLDTGEKR